MALLSNFQSIEEAFAVLDYTEDLLPEAAIEFLQQQPTSPEIIDKIVFMISNAFNSELFEGEYSAESETSGLSQEAPLWYAIVAENHLTPELTPALTSALLPNKTEDSDWDWFNEQLFYLMGTLASKYPETVPLMVLEKVEEELKKPKPNEFLFFVFDAFYALDLTVYGDRLLKILKNPKTSGAEMLGGILADINYKEALPAIRDLRDLALLDLELGNASEFALNQLVIEYNEAIDILTGKKKPLMSDIYFRSRDHWKKHYQKYGD
ncbi:MAG: hypothetical protein R3C61_05710 [Bacteroidia bacterium]